MAKFNVGDRVVCRLPYNGPLGELVEGQVYIVSKAHFGSTIQVEGNNATWWGDGRFDLHLPAGFEDAVYEAFAPSVASDPQPLPEPEKELTPEDKLRIYRRSLRDMLGQG